MKSFLYLSVIVILAACSAKVSGPLQSDVDRSTNKYPGITLSGLQNGKKLYDENCGLCHDLKKPGAYTEAQWQQIVPDMARKVNKKAGTTKLDDKASDEILRYLVVMGPDKK